MPPPNPRPGAAPAARPGAAPAARPGAAPAAPGPRAIGAAGEQPAPAPESNGEGHALTRWCIPLDTSAGPVEVTIDTDQRPDFGNPGAVDIAVVGGHLAGLAGALLTRNWRAAGAAGLMLLNQAALYLSHARLGLSWKPAKPAPVSEPPAPTDATGENKGVAPPAGPG